MFGVPADAMWIWIGLLLGSAAMFGVIVDLPAAPPDADRVASAVESVQAIEYTSTARVPVEATEVKLTESSVALRGPGGTGHATFAGGTVTPVRPGTRLSDVLHGRSPQEAFPVPGSLRRAVTAARRRPATWRAAGDSLTVRRVRYGEVDCVLVGV